MTDKEIAPATLVDRDAGETWAEETIVLDYPVKVQGVSYSGLTMRAPTGLDVQRFYGSARPSVVDFAIGLLGVAPAVFNALHGKDAAKIVRKASDFLG